MEPTTRLEPATSRSAPSSSEVAKIVQTRLTEDWLAVYSGPRGKFQFGTQYSYVTRQTWSGIGPGAGTPEGLDNMVFTSFRYYLP